MSRPRTQQETKGEAPASLRPALPWLLGMLALGALAIVVGLVRLDQLPDPYPVHFGPAGDPDRFEARSAVTVLMPAVVGLLSGLAVFATLLLVRSQGHVRLVQPLAALGFVIGGGISLVSLAQYLSEDAVAPGWGLWLVLAAILATLVWIVVASLRSGGGSRDDREGWRLWGLVYADPEDPHVFVPKRTGVGTTVNFGRPMGWVVMALILVPAVAVIWFAASVG